MSFIDEVKIYIKSGNGGPGCAGFRREKYIEYGGPDGGDGGKGGDIIFIATRSMNTLLSYRNKQHFRAKNGEGGKGSNKYGKAGDDIILEVPLGTQIYDQDRTTIIKDMMEEGERFTIAKGGDGGFGNVKFKTSTNRAPRRTTPGFPGEEKWIWLKLKLISDVGIIGLPNAGKSSFLASVSAARPKIADYPFTTLEPKLGVVGVNDLDSFVIADIPGLIEGASEGVGLGDKFLKHVERCKILLHLIDVTSEDIVKSYKVIRQELINYSKSLKEKHEIIVLNKIDLLSEEEVEKKRLQLGKILKTEVMICSTITRKNLPVVIQALYRLLNLYNQD